MSTFLTISIIIAGQVTYPNSIFSSVKWKKGCSYCVITCFFLYDFKTLSASLCIINDIMLAPN